MTRPAWYFVLPEESTKPSGGNIYNDHIIRAIGQAGQPVEIISAENYREVIHQDHKGTYWVDTLVLDQMPELFSHRISQAQSLLIVHHLESLAPSPHQSAEVLRAQEKSMLDWFQGFLATSAFTRDYLQQQGCTQPILVAEPGVNAIGEVPHRTTESIHALMVANLIERKSILPWLQWLADNAKIDERFSLTIVGRTDIETEYAQRCLNLVHNHPLLSRCITVAGSQSPERMSQFYRQANLFISTAQMETFGMAIQEAVSNKSPVLALEGGYSAHHISPGKNGQVFSHLTQLGDFFLTIVREPAKFATLYQQAQQYSPAYRNWPQTARLLLQQFDQFFHYAS